MKHYSNGFSAVELLIAIFIGVILLSASYQLYTVVLSSSGASQLQAKASNVAYDFLRQYEPNATEPCSIWSVTPTIPTTAGLPGATATVVASCPFNEYNPDSSLKRASNATLITVTVNYDSPNTKKVVRALSVTQQ